MKTLFLVMLGAVLGIIGWVGYETYFPEIVEIKDPVLRECILEKLARKKGDITAREVRGIIDLNCKQSGLDYIKDQLRIKSLEGIEYLKELRTLDLSDQNITDPTPLLKLKKLKRVKIAGNQLQKSAVKTLKKRGVKFTGKLSSRTVAKVMRRKKKEIHLCYDAALQRNETLEGKITIVFSVDTKGGVSDISFKRDTLNDQKMADCMVEVMKKTRFPQFFGKIFIVKYPFKFSKPQSEKEKKDAQKSFRKVMKIKKKEMNQCYERALKQNKNLEGEVFISFHLNAKGHVDDALFTLNTLNNEEMEHCMITAMKNTQFSKAYRKKTSRVSYHFQFSKERLQRLKDRQRRAEERRERLAESPEEQLSRKSIRRAVYNVIGNKKKELKQCYDASLKRNEDPEGTVVVSFHINPDGAGNISFERNMFNDQKMERCMVEVMKNIKFPQSSGKNIRGNLHITLSKKDAQHSKEHFKKYLKKYSGKRLERRSARKLIGKIIRGNVKEMNQCYKSVLKHPVGDLDGYIIPSYDINSEGIVNVSFKRNGLNNKELEGCIEAVIKGLWFPKFSGKNFTGSISPPRSKERRQRSKKGSPERLAKKKARSIARKIIQSKKKEIAQCSRMVKEKKKEIKRIAVISFYINKEGFAEDISFKKHTVNDYQKMENCMAAVIKKIHFPEQSRKIRISHVYFLPSK